MNQRLLVILAVLLLIVGAFGLLMSSGTPRQSSAPAPTREVNYFVTAKALSAGTLLRAEDVDAKTESVPEDTVTTAPEIVSGMFLLKDKPAGERILSDDISPDDPKNKLAAANMIRYNTVINERFTGAIQQLRPGDYVDVYLRFASENTRTRRKNSEAILQGESSLNLFRIFEARRVISRPEKAAATLLERQSLMEGSSDHKKATGSLTLDLELSQSDLKRLYLVNQKYEVILFPTRTEKVQRKVLSTKQGAAK